MILITGGNGYIGTVLSNLLIENGEEFRVMDDLSGSDPLNLLFLNHINFFWGDIRKKQDVKKAFKDVDTVIHLAAKLPTTPGVLDEVKEEVSEVNYNGTLNVLEQARKSDSKVLFASSCNIYGIGENLNEQSETKPLNSYSQSKLEAEKLCLDYHRNYGLNVKILRLASNYGYSPGVRFNLVINYFVLRSILGYPLTVFGDGNNWRPFIHVKDAARSFLYLIDKGKSGEIYNVGGENLTIKEVAELVTSKIHPPIKVEFDDSYIPEFSYSVDFSKILELGFQPEYDLEMGIEHLSHKLRDLKELRK
ncbi:MAG: NAD-dependent epimerase/dehydratase family protein [Archaeoglobaceae archaeon]